MEDQPTSSSSSSSSLTKEKMLEYLKNQEKLDCVLSIRHPQVVQKSYGNEKRFFRPSPSISLLGDGWKEKQRQLEASDQSHNDSGFEEGEQNQEEPGNLVASVGLDAPSEKVQQFVEFSKGKDHFAAESLHINDSDGRKFFKLSTQLFYDFKKFVGLGRFQSRLMKVICKPSKSMKSTEDRYMCVQSGTEVALFNRHRSQTARYLNVENEEFQASSTKWGSFVICLCNDKIGKGRESDEFFHNEGFVHYGSIIKLFDTKSGKTLPRMRVRKIFRDCAVLNEYSSSEVVSQLHKCAFQLVSNEFLYLSLSHDRIIFHTATPVTPHRHRINDEAVWTIISTKRTDYRFYEALGPVERPIAPFPVVNGAEFTGDGAKLVLHGFNMRQDVTIWLGATPIDTRWRTDEAVMGLIPSWGPVYEAMKNEDGSWPKQVEIPISLVRDDGVIYSSSFFI